MFLKICLYLSFRRIINYINATEETALASKGGIHLVLGTTGAKNYLSENLSMEYLIYRQMFHHANTAFLDEGKAPASLTPPAPHQHPPQCNGPSWST